MSTNQGLFGADEGSAIAATEGRNRPGGGMSIGPSDGLRSTEPGGGLQSCAAKSADGTLWFASVKGLVGYNPNTTMSAPDPPPVKIEAVEVNGKRIPVQDAAEIGYTACPLRPGGICRPEFRRSDRHAIQVLS